MLDAIAAGTLKLPGNRCRNSAEIWDAETDADAAYAISQCAICPSGKEAAPPAQPK